MTSPTFTLRHRYIGRLVVEHLDLYRLGGPEEVEDAGLLESEPGALVLVEWAQLFPECFPDFTLRLRLSHVDADRRELELATGPHGRRLAERLPELTAALAPPRPDC